MLTIFVAIFFKIKPTTKLISFYSSRIKILILEDIYILSLKNGKKNYKQI
jgi:hypothetical protein